MRTPLSLLDHAVDEAALHGRQGIHLNTLWQSLKLTEPADQWRRDMLLASLRQHSDVTIRVVPGADPSGPADTRVIATEALRLRTLGFTSPAQAARFLDPVEPTLSALEEVARSRDTGLLAPALAEKLGS